MLKNINLCVIGNHQTLEYAAQEMKAALHKVLDRDSRIVIVKKEKYDSLEQNALWIGLSEAFPKLPLINVVQPAMDDAIIIEVEALNGIIAGINARSVLLAVYRFLTEIGFRWIRPGTDGEIVPEPNKIDNTVKITETASYRHRGICIEGAVSYENVAELIDWAPKVGFNGYFIQFMTPFTFFERWHSHRNNPSMEPELIDVARVEQFVSELEKEIKKRDLIYHAVGHGWTCEPLGIAGLGWDQKQYEVDPEIAQYLAEVNGKREIWEGVPLNTNLCYSNLVVRRLMIDSISQYLKTHKEIDILHLWLADGVNNHCECESCSKVIPSDFYVLLLNELDEKLALEFIETKIVFLVYVDLLWSPEVMTFINPDRFIMMFAPITRTYSHSFKSDQIQVELPRYERNKLQFSDSVGVNLGLLQGWQHVFQGDSFDFDYHFMWDHYKDPGYYSMALLLSEDIKNLKSIGLNGYMSCQTQRTFFPTGLGMYVMGKTLWNDQAIFEELADDYFTAAFGLDGGKCKAYLSHLSDLFDPPYLRKEKNQVDQESDKRFAQIPGLIDSFKKVIENNRPIANKQQAKSWEYLSYHAELCTLLAEAFTAKAAGNPEKALQGWIQTKEYAQKIESFVQPVFDVFEFIFTLEGQHFPS